MIISTQDHPITSKIPKRLWNSVFQSQWDTDELKVEQHDFSEITRSDLPANNEQALILVLILYPDVSIQACHQFLGINNYPFELEFEFVIEQDRMDILKYLEEHDPKALKNAIQPDNYSIFEYASKAGSIHFLKWFYETYPKEFAGMVTTLKHAPHRDSEENTVFRPMINKRDYHPVAKKMPHAIWYKIFHGHCYTKYLTLNADFSDLKREDLPQNDEQALIILMLNYPDINPMIFQLYFNLIPSAGDFLEIAPFRIDIYKWLKGQYPNNLVTDEITVLNLLFYAIKEGLLADFEWIKAQVGQQTIIDLIPAYASHFHISILTDCVKNGRLDVVQWLYTQLPKTAFKALMEPDGYPIQYGCLPILEWLNTIMPSELDLQLNRSIQNNTFIEFVRGPTIMNLDVIKWIQRNKSSAFNYLITIKANLDNLLFEAYHKGDFSIFEWVRTVVPQNLSNEFIHSHNTFEHKFIHSAPQWLNTYYPDTFSCLFEEHSAYFFKVALFYSNIPAMDYLKRNFPHEFHIWCNSANNNWWLADCSQDFLCWLKDQITTEQFYTLITQNDYSVLYHVASRGYLDVLKWFIEQLSITCNQLPQTLIVSFFEKQTHLDILVWLKDQIPDRFEAMMKASKYSACFSAVEYNHLEVLVWFREVLSDESFKELLELNDYDIFQWAVKYENLDILKYFKEQAPDIWNTVLQNNYYELAINAATAWFSHFFQSKIDVLTWIKEEAPNQFQRLLNLVPQSFFQMVYQNFFHKDTFYSINHADPITFRNDTKKLMWLLTHHEIFAYAEAHHAEYNRVVEFFVDQMLETLQNESAAQSAHDTHVVFNIDEERARFYFYVARNIIRRNDPDLNGQLRFLLEIPAIKALAHQNLRDARSPNELLRFAMHIGNEHASEILLNIEAVRELAEQNNYYVNENRGGVDLAQLARDQESSMTALTQGETQRFEKIIQQYTPDMQRLLASNIMAMLRQDLRAHYNDNPAFIMVDGKRFNLPVDYDDFESLSLSTSDRKVACQAYFQNTAHSALRYISKPNRWMHPNAAYVCVSEDRTQRWSTFEDYRNIICLFYLAAIDKTKPPVNMQANKALDKKTAIELRLQLFFKELALIGRAHNWDHERIRDDGRREEYDDMEYDRPSCFSGVKRRLFQSVQDHPLLIMIEQVHMEYELRQFAFEHFKTVLSEQDAAVVKAVFEEVNSDIAEIDIPKIRSIKILDHFNIPMKKQNAFIDHLSEKYGSDFNRFRIWMRTKLALDPHSVRTRYHLMTLYALTDFYEYLEKVVTEGPTLPSTSESPLPPNTGNSLSPNTSTSNSRGLTAGPSDVEATLDPAAKSRELGKVATPPFFYLSMNDLEKIGEINAQLAILHLKIIELDKGHYIKAHHEAQTIHEKLTKLVNKCEDGIINVQKLKEKSKPILEKRHELEQFRGWKLKKVGEVLANLAILIFSLGISYAVTQQFTLFKVKTDAHEKIEALSDAINKDSTPGL